MRRAIVNVLILIAAFVLDHSAFPFFYIFPVSPNLLLIIVFTIAFVYGEREGLLYGLLAGLLMDTFYSGPFGYYTLIFIWIGFVNGLFTRYYYEDYIVLPISLCILNEVFYSIYLMVLKYLTQGSLNIGFAIKRLIMPEVVLTVLFTLILYRPLLALNRVMKKLDTARKGNKLVQ